MNTLVKGYMEEAHRGVLSSRDELIVSHLPLVKYLVKRIAANLPSYLDEDDLISVAVIGLITSADRFEPSRGIRFKTFAEQRIKGNIYDELRAQDWFSRSVREKYKRLEREIMSLSHKLGRDPESEEIAASLHMELEDYYEPFTFRYQDLFNAPAGDDQPTAIPVSQVTGEPMQIKGGPNWDSFPSDTSALAFAPAQFLWQRYGWEYGLPAYAAATFVGWSRVLSPGERHAWTSTFFGSRGGAS